MQWHRCLADKDFKAVVTVSKDVQENMLLMNEKIAYLKEIETIKKEPTGNSKTEKCSIQNKI